MSERSHGPEQKFYLEAVRRSSLLDALYEESHTASELVDSLDQSRSTVHRAISILEEHNLIEKSNGAYELTSYGEAVAEETSEFTDRLSTAHALEPFLNTTDIANVPIEHFHNARITRPRPRLPHASIQRIIELIEESDTLHILSTVLSPVYVNVSYREMLEGMTIEAVFEPEAIDIMLSEYEEKAHETMSIGNFSVYFKEEVPFELFLFDDRMGMAAHDDTGIAQVFIESETTDAIEWAEHIYETHREEAEPLVVAED